MPYTDELTSGLDIPSLSEMTGAAIDFLQNKVSKLGFVFKDFPSFGPLKIQFRIKTMFTWCIKGSGGEYR